MWGFFTFALCPATSSPSCSDANLQHLTVLELCDSPVVSANRSGRWH